MITYKDSELFNDSGVLKLKNYVEKSATYLSSVADSVNFTPDPVPGSGFKLWIRILLESDLVSKISLNYQ